jgi:hypothetical protein
MKRLLFLIGMLGSTCFSQSIETNISLSSENRDTLWLINDDLGKSIARSWEIGMHSSHPKPVIILVDNLPYRRRKKRDH